MLSILLIRVDRSALPPLFPFYFVKKGSPMRRNLLAVLFPVLLGAARPKSFEGLRYPSGRRIDSATSPASLNAAFLFPLRRRRVVSGLGGGSRFLESGRRSRRSSGSLSLAFSPFPFPATFRFPTFPGASVATGTTRKKAQEIREKSRYFFQGGRISLTPTPRPVIIEKIAALRRRVLTADGAAFSPAVRPPTATAFFARRSTVRQPFD